MNINATFFLQIINFTITYFFLKKILLTPTLLVLKGRESARQKLLDNLKNKEFFLKKRIEEKNSSLIDFRSYLKRRYKTPLLENLEISSEIIYKRSKADIDRLIALSKDMLVKKVPHAH